MINQSEAIFGGLPKEYPSLIDKVDHPELDMSEDLQHYQSLIGGSQWSVSLGCYGMQWAIMTMGKFHAAPIIGHLNCLQCVCGYLP
jgi:hypothetical protein